MQVLRSRLRENGPHLVSWVLIALMLLDGARAITLSMRADPSPPTLSVVRQARPKDSPLHVQSIVAAHLFGIATASSAGDPDSALPTTAALELHGTFATVDPRHGWAILTDDGSEKLYVIGERIGNAALYSVYTDHVLMDHDGRLERLSMPHAVRSERIESVAAGSAAIAPVKQGPHQLAEIMRVEPSIDEDSQSLIGFRIAPVAPASGIIKAGLRPYDVVTAVNGTLLTGQDRQRSRQILDAALASGSATLGILRGSVHLDVSVELPH